MEEPTPPPAPPTAPIEPTSIAQSTAKFPPPPSPSTVAEPPMAEPGAGAAAGVVAVVVGIGLLIVVLIAGIAVAAVFAFRTYTAHHRPAQPVTVPLAQVPLMPPQPPVAVSPPTASDAPAMPPALPLVPPPQTAAVERGPFITSMSPTTGNVGDTITLRGHGLGQIEDVILFPQHGGASVETAIQSTDDRTLTFAVPAVEKPDGFQTGDGYYLGVFSKTGACLFVDGTFRSSATTDSPKVSHDAVRVTFGSPLVGGDHLLVFGNTGAMVSVGTDCVVLLRPDCVLKDYGGGCKIFYMPPLRGMTPEADGLIPMTDIRLSQKGSRLMLKPLGDPGLPPDPNK